MQKELSFYPPPAVPLKTDNPYEILKMLEYAGIHYRGRESEAAKYGVFAFNTARQFISDTNFDRITFDWDHTLGNYQIFEDVAAILRARLGREQPAQAVAEAPMSALEVTRPMMGVLAFGAMVGYAIDQGLGQFDQWEHYEPQVGVATLTWPDRISILATYVSRLVPLMAGLLPGTPGMYERIHDPENKAFVHLHDFLDYADFLLPQFEARGFAGLSPSQQDETMAYCEDGKAHHRKPMGALARKGWEFSSLLHFDDSMQVIKDLKNFRYEDDIHGLLVRQPHPSLWSEVQEWHKVSLPPWWRFFPRARDIAMADAAATLARVEASGATIQAILGALQTFGSNTALQTEPMQRAPLPEGVLLMVHETTTTVGDFWTHYVAPTTRLKERIRQITKKRGGITRIRQDYERVRQ